MFDKIPTPALAERLAAAEAKHAAGETGPQYPRRLRAALAARPDRPVMDAPASPALDPDAPPTAPFKITEFMWAEMDGSGITDAVGLDGHAAGDDYDPLIAQQFRNPVQGRGTTLHLTAAALTDLAEWCGDLSNALSDGGNHAGARSLRTHQAKALALASELVAA